VQTFRSMTWRRRYFHLFGTEMKLFKSEGVSAAASSGFESIPLLVSILEIHGI
jgi:hypothetical protein